MKNQQDQYRDQAVRAHEMQAQEDAERKRLDKDRARGYKSDLQQQELGKQQRHLAERQQDLVYAQLGSAQQEKDQVGRQRFFDHMKGYQERTDAKTA